MKLCVMVVLLLLAGTLLPTSANADTTTPLDISLSSVLDAYFSWRGGAPFEQMQSIHAKGQREGFAQTTNEYWLDRTGRRRFEVDFGGIKKVEVAVPEAAWTINPSGQAEDDSVGSIRARRRALIEFGEALRGSGGAQVKIRGGIRRAPWGTSEASEERLWAVVEVGFGDADAYYLLIDPASGMLGWFTAEESGQTTNYAFADWRMVDGVRMPFRTAIYGDTDTGNIHLSSLEINQPIDQSLFSRPSSRGGITYLGADRSSGWVKIRMEDGRILFPVMVNGHQTTAWLDSGASISVINPQFAKMAGLTPQGDPMSARGVGPALETGRWVSGANISIGNLTLGGITLGAMEPQYCAMGDGTCPLILGDDAFAELIVDLDCPHHRIRFLDPQQFSKPSHSAEIPLSRSGEQLSIPVSIEGRKPIQLVLDLGDSGLLSVFPEYAQSERLFDGRKLSQSMFAGIGGIQTQTDVILPEVTFGATRLSDVPVSVLPQRVRGTYSTKVQGSIGTKILDRYRLILDVPHNRVFAIPDPKAIGLPFDKNRLGVSWLPEGDHILVMLVVPNSPAAHAGLTVGDKIAWINGQPAKGWQSARARNALKEGPAGNKITFTLENGESKTVTLGDYY